MRSERKRGRTDAQWKAEQKREQNLLENFAQRVKALTRMVRFACDVATSERDTRGPSEHKRPAANPSVHEGEFHLYQLDNDELNDTGNAAVSSMSIKGA